MIGFSRGAGGVFAAVAVGLALSSQNQARAEDLVFYRTVAELTIVEGRLPRDTDPPGPDAATRRPPQLTPASWLEPYVVVDGAGEVYLGRALDQAWPTPLHEVKDDDVVAFRLPARREVTGRLFAPRSDGSGMAVLRFKVAPPPAQANARSRFARARERHYERLLARGLPGAAWFAYRARQAGASNQAAQANRTSPDDDSSAELRALALFSGGRAIDENLQLDRPLPERGVAAAAGAKPLVKTDSLAGITVAEIDWTPRLKGKTPALDPLAASIPADQHAVFVPNLSVVGSLFAELHGGALAIIGLALPHSEDGSVQRKYERQLGVALADLPGSPAATSIRSLAVTGSDPYLPSGTDLAVLVDTASPDQLADFLKSRIEAARQSEPEAVDAGGQIDGTAFRGLRTPDRRLCTYLATLGNVVVLTNSRAQLERLVRVAQRKTPALAELPEYRFFRDRYPRADGDESAFLVLTDATIRRWCGPKWRIGSSHRVRAAAALAELQAANLERLAADGGPSTPAAAPKGLGTVHMTGRGPRSETYGTIDFQTPILELPLDEVEQTEADSYTRWRDTYQQNWRGMFDPIAVSFSVRPGRVAADVSVMPLIAASEYRPFLDLVGNARIATDASDRHAGTLVHASMALDTKAALLGQAGQQVSAITRIPGQVALGWLGGTAALYLDDDPTFWKELGAAERADAFLSERINSLPLGAHIAVVDGVKLALFLSGLRAFVDQSAPNATTWENREYKGLRYVKVAEAQEAPAGGRPRFALYYVTTPRSLTLSLNEGVIRRFIERQGEKPERRAQARPWLGESLALEVSRQGLEVLRTAGRPMIRDELRGRSWENLPILNEWKRLFPERDPVDVHDEAWGVRLVDPAGGRYVWNPEWSTMESTVFGHPGEPKRALEANDPLARFATVEAGLSFEDGGLRARVEIGSRDSDKEGKAATLSTGRAD